MGIKFRCHGCDNKLHVKAFLAGKKGVCPHCGAKVRIPLGDEHNSNRGGRASSHADNNKKSARAAAAVESESNQAVHTASSTAKDQVTSASAEPAAEQNDAISEVPEAVWYVRPPSGGQYGPADGEIMRRWLNEGRISADSLVWREGWSDWRTGDSVFPSLRGDPRGADVPVSEVAAASRESQQGEFVLGDGNAATSRARPRLPSKSHGLGVAVVVTLSIVCLVLLVGLWIVLN
ncbi:MAG: DUF4339 domain-containing protein [Planctomycetota bacterium]